MGSYTPITLTSHEITSVEQSTRREHSSWDNWNFVGGFGYSSGPFGYGQRPWYAATGTPADRRAGRQLPLFWSEIDLRGFRLVARDLDSRNQFAIGFLNLLTAYHVHKGYGWQATYRGASKTPYPTKRTADPVLKRAQQVLDAWRDANLWPLKSREAFRRWRREGEVFGRFFPSGWDRLPQFRFIDPERVGSPSGDVNSPESFGVRTDEDDVCDVIEYHVWESPDGTVGKWIDADRIVHAKCNVDTGVKRGVTDFLPVAEDFDWCRRILRSMLVSSQRQASKAWIEKLPGATAEQVRGMVPYVPGRTTQSINPSNAYDPFDGYRGYGYDPSIREPDGSIMRTEGDREFAMTPGSNVQGYIEAMQASLRGGCVRWNLPEFATSDASNNNYASALVANSPFTRTVEGCQYEFGAVWERPVALKVLELAADAGLIDVADLRRLDVEITEPQVASAEPDKDAQTNNVLHAAGVMSATTWQLKLGLDPQHEAANFEQEKRQGMQPGPEPTDDQTPPDAESTR